VLLMVLGGGCGLVIALTVVKLGSRQWDDLRVSPEQLLQGLALMLATGVLVSLLPALRAQRLPVVDALRSVRR